MFVANDFSSVSFRIRPQARFSNGDPVTPADVAHSFKTLSGKGASPTYQTVLSGIERAEVVDARTVRFDLSEKTRDQVFNAGTMPVFSAKWGDGQEARRDRHRLPHRRRPLPDRQGRHAAAHRIRAQPQLLGRAGWRCARATSISTA